MRKLNNKWLLGAALATMLVTGCGSDGDGGGGGGGASASTNIGQSVSALVTYLNSLIAGTSETSDPVDINSVTLATDDLADPTPIN